jgi:Uma2 family endonuclease
MGFMELEGTPDMVMEIVSKSSVEKDTVLLRELYWRAGIAEYWLVDAREGKQSFQILRFTPEGYVSSPAEAGGLPSKVLGKKFQMQQKADPLGHPQFFLLSPE